MRHESMRTLDPQAARLAMGIKSRRLRRLFHEVWERLPSTHRQILAERMTFVHEEAFLKDDNRKLLGWAWPEEFEGRFFNYAVFLNQANLKNHPDTMCRWVIAHELAHVLHEHSAKQEVMSVQECEDEADDQVRNWGFTQTRYILLWIAFRKTWEARNSNPKSASGS